MHMYILVFLLLQFSFAPNEALELPQPSAAADSVQNLTANKSVAENLVFKSTDGGQTWHDISAGLPANSLGGGISSEGFVANETGLYVRAGNELYHNTPNATASVWQKEFFPYSQGTVAPGNQGIFALNYDGQLLKRTNGKSLWTPVYPNLEQKMVRTVFETAGGTLFVGSDDGLFKSANGGKNWKHVHANGWVIKFAEANGVLLATNQGGIIRSTDGGETWERVLSEGGVGIDVEPIDGGFAAIVYNTQLEARTVRASYDDGKTWQAIDAGLIPHLSIASIVQVGEYFFCGHPKGIFRSSDMGKTWTLLLPSVESKVFDLTVSGSTIYAIAGNQGC